MYQVYTIQSVEAVAAVLCWLGLFLLSFCRSALWQGWSPLLSVHWPRLQPSLAGRLQYTSNVRSRLQGPISSLVGTNQCMHSGWGMVCFSGIRFEQKLVLGIPFALHWCTTARTSTRGLTQCIQGVRWHRWQGYMHQACARVWFT